ncbi:MAG: glutaredoxin 3 [Robiginitomaculum sp.]|nr:MAG: glutaredoxin 3 [Robiginitomaculum sp.]
MKSVTIYTRAFCPYCVRAIMLLKKKSVNFKKIDAGMNAQLRREMIQRANGGSSYPQIFIDQMHIGGCDEMMALERAGKLDALLSA